MEYRGVKIETQEVMPNEDVELIGSGVYGKLRPTVPTYVAASRYGVAIANRPGQALDDAKALIDGGLRVR